MLTFNSCRLCIRFMSSSSLTVPGIGARGPWPQPVILPSNPIFDDAERNQCVGRMELHERQAGVEDKKENEELGGKGKKFETDGTTDLLE